MRQFKQIKPRDIIAVVVVVGALILRKMGTDGLVSLVLVSVVAYYFGIQRPSDFEAERLQKFIEQKEGGEDVESQKGSKENEGQEKRKSVEDRIAMVCREKGIDPTLGVRVARAESGLDPEARNTNEGGSVDRGVFQWNDMYHPEITDECAFDVECATRAFCKAVKAGHLDWWDATRDEWER